jgi:hypothetical protein
MMSSWNTPGFCKRKAKSGAFYPLTYGDRFSIAINDQDHIEYKQNGFLVYKSRYTAAYYLSRGTGANRRLANSEGAEHSEGAKDSEGAEHSEGADSEGADSEGAEQYSAKASTIESYSDSAADLAMCSSSGYDSQNPKFFAAFSLLQGNDGELHGWRVQDAFFTERDEFRPINLHLEATSELQSSRSRNTVSTVITASCIAVATAFFVTGLVVYLRRSRAETIPPSVENTKAPVLAAGLASI